MRSAMLVTMSMGKEQENADDVAFRLSFGRTLRILRVKRNISQDELADRAGVHRTFVGQVERGLRNISLSNIRKLAAGLGVDVVDLFRPLEEGEGELPSELPKGHRRRSGSSSS